MSCMGGIGYLGSVDYLYRGGGGAKSFTPSQGGGGGHESFEGGQGGGVMKV